MTDVKLTAELLEHVIGKQEEAHRYRSSVVLTRGETDALIAAALELEQMQQAETYLIDSGLLGRGLVQWAREAGWKGPIEMTDAKLTVEELDELEALSAEVDRLHGHFEDGGGKNIGVAQQLTYAEEALGAKMAQHRLALIAAARASLESRCDAAADKFIALRKVWEDCPDSDMDPFTEFCRHFDWSLPSAPSQPAEVLDTMEKAPSK